MKKISLSTCSSSSSSSSSYSFLKRIFGYFSFMSKSPLLSAESTERSSEPAESARDEKMKGFWENAEFRPIALKVLYLGWQYHGLVRQESTEETVEVNLYFI